jgi:hypothetical protein
LVGGRVGVDGEIRRHIVLTRTHSHAAHPQQNKIES